MDKLRKNPAVEVEVLEPLPRMDLRLSFRTRDEEKLIRRLQKIPERRAVAILFERRGCLHCHSHSVPHAANGLCAKCRRQLYYELAKIDGEIARGEI